MPQELNPTISGQWFKQHFAEVRRPQLEAQKRHIESFCHAYHTLDVALNCLRRGKRLLIDWPKVLEAHL